MLKVSEHFYSIQGEGLYIGTPSIFIRLFGCNFTCAGFSMPRGELSKERFDVDPTKYTDYKALPLVHTGCDSYASWDVRFKHLSKDFSYDEILKRNHELIVGRNFGPNLHVILTGGEPLLKGVQKKLVELIDRLYKEQGLTHLTFETNGTQELTPELMSYLYSNKYIEVTFSISSKLPSSGEKFVDAIKPNVVKQYTEFSKTSYFKWVVSNEEDLVDVKAAEKVYKHVGVDIPIYLMPAGGTVESYAKNERWVVDLCMKEGYRFSQRLQVPLFKNQWGT